MILVINSMCMREFPILNFFIRRLGDETAFEMVIELRGSYDLRAVTHQHDGEIPTDDEGDTQRSNLDDKIEPHPLCAGVSGASYLT